MSDLVPTGSKYSDEDRFNAIRIYAIEGTFTRTSEVVNIPERTLNGWGKEDWWVDELTKVRDLKRQEHVTTYTKIVDEAHKVTLAKLPEATAAQANLIACQATDKALLLDGKPTSINGDSSSTKSVLRFLDQISADYHKQVEIKDSVVSTQEPEK